MIPGKRKSVGAAWRLVAGLLFVMSAASAHAQTVTPGPSGRTVVTKVDSKEMLAAIAPKGRPVLVNFWATWCDPCREEFPDLVRIADEYAGRIDVVTVSLDDPAEIDTAVASFLTEMKASMPSYLLSTNDEDAAITSVSKEWGGALPFTIIYDSAGRMSYQKLGKFRTDVLKAAIDRTLGTSANPQ
jgi:thiol-disulfide isomerase/thioredoxin